MTADRRNEGEETMDTETPRDDADAGSAATAADRTNLTLPDYLLAGALQRGRKPALVDAATGAELAYADLAAAVGEIGAGLTARGLVLGDVLALCAPNGIAFVTTYLAALSAGAVVTTVNPLWTPAEIGRQLGQASARWVAGPPPCWPARCPVWPGETAGPRRSPPAGRTPGRPRPSSSSAPGQPRRR